MAGKSLNVEIVRVFATNLRARRLELGISQEALADKAGLDRTYVSSCERGLRNVTLSSLEQLSRALGVEAHYLIRRAD
jgi:transcriptional regulator with XRE-family HTH domain